MIINGGKRAFWRKFAPHLMNTEKGQQQVRIVEMRGLAADNLSDAFQELEALGSGTRAKSFYYHANIDPRADEHMTEEQWDHAVDALEKNLGLDGRSRFIVEHEKNGRTHRHVVWSRVTDDMKVVPCDWNYSIHQRTADQLEKEFGHEKTPRQRAPGKPRGPRQYEYVRGKQSKIPPKEVEAELTALWHQCDSGPALAAAIAEHGYILAEGRRGLCVVDWKGHEHSLARRCGVRVKDVDARMADVLDRETLPTVEEARKLARSRAAGRDRHDEVKQPDPAPPPADPTKARDKSRTIELVADEVLHTAKDAIAGKERVAPSLADIREPEPAPQAAPPTKPEPTAFERLARKLTEAVQAFGGGPTAAESLDPARQPAAPPSGPPGPPGPDAFERLVTEALRGAKEVAPIAEELGVAAAVTEPSEASAFLRDVESPPTFEAHAPVELPRELPEQALSEFDAFWRDLQESMREGGGEPSPGIGLRWLERSFGPEPPAPASDASSEFDRFVDERNAAMRRNGGEPVMGDGLSVWDRMVAVLSVARDRAVSWAEGVFRDFVGRLDDTRNRGGDDHGRER
jgi:hypothetical protein